MIKEIKVKKVIPEHIEEILRYECKYCSYYATSNSDVLDHIRENHTYTKTTKIHETSFYYFENSKQLKLWTRCSFFTVNFSGSFKPGWYGAQKVKDWDSYYIVLEYKDKFNEKWLNELKNVMKKIYILNTL